MNCGSTIVISAREQRFVRGAFRLGKAKMQSHQLKHHVCGIHFGYAKNLKQLRFVKLSRSLFTQGLIKEGAISLAKKWVMNIVKEKIKSLPMR
jgi:hypothetical protein